MEKRIITVSKTVSAKVAPNNIVIHVRTECDGKTSKDATQKENALSAAFKKAMNGFISDGLIVALCDARISKITQGGKAVGYKACRDCTVECEYDGEKLIAVTDALEGLGVSLRVEFTYEDDGLKNALIKQAVESARADAEIIAAAAGVKITAFARAEYASSDGAGPMLLRAAPMNSFADGITEPQPITVSQSVTCSWEVE